jgi:hypothetical protein
MPRFGLLVAEALAGKLAGALAEVGAPVAFDSD